MERLCVFSTAHVNPLDTRPASLSKIHLQQRAHTRTAFLSCFCYLQSCSLCLYVRSLQGAESILLL